MAGLAGEVVLLQLLHENGHRLGCSRTIQLNAEGDIVQRQLAVPAAAFGDGGVRDISEIRSFRIRSLHRGLDRNRNTRAGGEIENLGDGRERDDDDGDDDRQNIVSKTAPNLRRVREATGVVVAKTISSRAGFAINALARCHVSSVG